MDFYDQLAPYYHLIFPDWDQSIERQAIILDDIISRFVNPPVSVLDAACGIGTQSLGLALKDYEVYASDISSTAIARARQEAEKRHVGISFDVCDMKELSVHWNREFDVVCACDNAVPHLLSDFEIREALHQMYRCTKPGGITIISVRDYEANPPEDGAIKYYGVKEEAGSRYIVFQVWSVDGSKYELSMYVVQDDKRAGIKTEVMRTHYYAIGLESLKALMSEAGFEEVQIIKDVYYQPVLVGRKDAS